MAKYIINLPKKDKILIQESDVDPVKTANGDTIEYSSIEEHHICDDCLAKHQDEFIPDGKKVVMVGIDVDTSGALCEKCQANTATKYIKKYLR